MDSPRKMASSSSAPSPRGVALVKTPRSPRMEKKIDSSQLTPRRRQQVEIQSSRGGTNLLPNRMTASAVTSAAAGTPRPKAAPRSPPPPEKQVEELPKDKEEKKIPIDIPKDKPYGERGSGDALLRLPLEGMSKLEIKSELRHGQMPLTFGYDLDKEDGDEEEEEEVQGMDTILEPDRARFNVWNGKNYDLHILGNFKSDFERRVKSFQRPDTERISLDPFCRSESGLVDEPTTSDAFLVWKSKSEGKWSSVPENDPIVSSPFPGSSGDDEEEDDGDSLPDPDMKEYIQSQQQKREEGLNATGETYYYDEDYEMVRNLHRDSYSLTNYGVMPDDKMIGKAHIFYPEMTEAEKKMLRVPEKKKASPRISPRIAVVPVRRPYK